MENKHLPFKKKIGLQFTMLFSDKMLGNLPLRQVIYNYLYTMKIYFACMCNMFKHRQDFYSWLQ